MLPLGLAAYNMLQLNFLSNNAILQDSQNMNKNLINKLEQKVIYTQGVERKTEDENEVYWEPDPEDDFRFHPIPQEKFILTEELRNKIIELNDDILYSQRSWMRNHVVSCEATMLGLFDYFKNKGEQIKEKRDEWQALALLHDTDLALTIQEDHGNQLLSILYAEEIEITQSIKNGIYTHDGIFGLPETLMEWCMYMIDDITWMVLLKAKERNCKIGEVTVDDVMEKINYIKNGKFDELEERLIEFNKESYKDIDENLKKIVELPRCKQRINIELDELIQLTIDNIAKVEDQINLATLEEKEDDDDIYD